MDSLNDTKDNLEQSIRLLNQGIPQRKSFLRLSSKSSTPKRIPLQHEQTNDTQKDGDNLRHVEEVYRPKISNSPYFRTRFLKNNDISDIDVSWTLEPQELRDIISGTGKSILGLKEIMDDSSATGIILKTNAPWRKVTNRLFYDFLQSIHCSEAEIFDTIADFIQNCTDTLAIMRDMQSKVEHTEVSEEEISLENERNTWRLIYCIYQNRINRSNFDTEIDDRVQSQSIHMSEKDIIENLYKTDNAIREYQSIIDWLEKNALDQADKYPTVEYFTDKTVAWENTLHQLCNKHTGISFASTRSLVTSLDPDAPIREGKSLHDLDKEDDARLEKRMFIEIRCGCLQKAQSLAMHCGQPWRAACMLGWIPHHDPNYKNPLTNAKVQIEGNPNRSLWKLCAWELSEDKRIGQYYRAVYASFCGNIQQILPIVRSWQDALWAYMKTLLDIKVEAEVRAMMAKSYTGMPEEYWKNEMSLEDIFKELHASQHQLIQAQANKPDHLIQKYIILDQIPRLMEEIENMLSQGNCDPQFLRFLAHLILFLRQIGKSTNEKIEVKVLLAYVRILIEMGDPNLIAFYTATLPQEDQITNYSHYLANIRDYEQRKKCLTAAEDANLNVEAITKQVVETIRLKNVEVDRSIAQNDAMDDDTDKINALDWLLFYQNQREEALFQTNALIRYFLRHEKVDAARKAFNKIPADAIDSIIADYPSVDGTIANLTLTNNLSKKASSAVREFLCYKVYLDAQEGFAEWFSHFHHGKPLPLDDLPPYATFTEKVAYDHKKAQYSTEMDRWKCTMQHHTKAVKQLLFNVLLFPDGGWLIDSNTTTNDTCTAEDVLREHQLEKLRELCIPKIVLLLHTVMSEMNEHTNCIQLADTLASEQYQLYKVFSKEKLAQVLKKICETSLTLMNQKKDPWGYPT